MLHTHEKLSKTLTLVGGMKTFLSYVSHSRLRVSIIYFTYKFECWITRESSWQIRWSFIEFEDAPPSSSAVRLISYNFNIIIKAIFIFFTNVHKILHIHKWHKNSKFIFNNKPLKFINYLSIAIASLWYFAAKSSRHSDVISLL
jgi:hypothetical protein